MPKGLFEVECPCCQATLKIDPETRAVISHKVLEKPAPIEDLAAAVAKLKGEAGRREEVFRKQFEAEKSRGQVLNTKFDELIAPGQRESRSHAAQTRHRSRLIFTSVPETPALHPLAACASHPIDS